MCRRVAWTELTAGVTLMDVSRQKVHGSYFTYVPTLLWSGFFSIQFYVERF
ncbi:hypothetical protein KP78_00130 [Jeotgalibacillus soli]|uniref:Uncharacterized protein n=1 Tax=Jeotgalibacillus soli TaxID=889306 RepID=A0A0C2VUQ4_9BACL|nr:hypothetical protein KP78_00130 [Jeotgalibacillus soli]